MFYAVKTEFNFCKARTSSPPKVNFSLGISLGPLAGGTPFGLVFANEDVGWDDPLTSEPMLGTVVLVLLLGASWAVVGGGSCDMRGVRGVNDGRESVGDEWLYWGELCWLSECCWWLARLAMLGRRDSAWLAAIAAAEVLTGGGRSSGAGRA